MGNKDKDKNQGDSAASKGAMGDLTSPGMPATPTETSARREKPGMQP